MATQLEDKIDPAALYEADFYAWAMHQAEMLRRFQATRPSLPLDLEHLIDEVEDLARSDLRAVRSQLRRLILHLLKLECSPADRPRRQWLNTVDDARLELAERLSPSVVGIVAPTLPELFDEARTAAARDLIDHNEAAAAAVLPKSCPYSFDQLRAKRWYQTNRHGLIDELF